MKKVDLAKYDNSDFDEGASRAKWALWFLANALIVRNSWNPFMGLKRAVLKLFGANIGIGVIIKTGVNVKFPWRLQVGNNVWLGENVWIENQGRVVIGNNSCLSQGATIMTGNHNYKSGTFDLMVWPVTLEEGVWIGAYAMVCPGVVCKSHSVLSINSVATGDMEAYCIYQGNPAVKVRERIIE